MKISHEVLLKTPTGTKRGKLSAELQENFVSGTLFIMNCENIFSGIIDKEGICHISGTLKTLFHSFSYEGNGVLTEQKVSLTLQTDRHKLRLSGGAELE